MKKNVGGESEICGLERPTSGVLSKTVDEERAFINHHGASDSHLGLDLNLEVQEERPEFDLNISVFGIETQQQSFQERAEGNGNKLEIAAPYESNNGTEPLGVLWDNEIEIAKYMALDFEREFKDCNGRKTEPDHCGVEEERESIDLNSSFSGTDDESGEENFQEQDQERVVMEIDDAEEMNLERNIVGERGHDERRDVAMEELPAEDAVLRERQNVIWARAAEQQREDSLDYDFSRREALARGRFWGEDRYTRLKEPILDVSKLLGNSSGPFSEALKIVRQRTLKKGSEKLIEWEPYSCIREPMVPSLRDLSLQSLVLNAEKIESLEQVPRVLCKRLSDMLCDRSKMDAHILNLLVQGCPTEICIKNCSRLTDGQLQQAFTNFQTTNLRVLKLELLGKFMLDLAFQEKLTQNPNSFSNLVIVSLRGSLCLSNTGLKRLVTSAPKLLSINLGWCSLLTSDAINIIADSLGPCLRELYIDDCLVQTTQVLPAFKKFKCLEVLSVSGIQDVSDEFISELVSVCGKSMKGLDLSNCQALTDSSLQVIGKCCTDLRSLNISKLDKVTDLGMEFLANGCRSIQKLHLCGNSFSDEAMAAFVKSSGSCLVELSLNCLMEVGPNTALSIATCSRGLKSLDVSWCRKIGKAELGLIVDSCSSLKLVKVFGNRLITQNTFLNAHSNPFVRIVGSNFTPLFESLNLFEPEHILLLYSPMPVCSED